MQNLVRKLGALNLMHQYLRESNIKNKEAVIGALSAFLRGDNFSSKEEFLKDFSGISFIKNILMDANSQSPRLYKKVLMILYDLVLCDD